MEIKITKNLLLHQWYYATQNATVEDTTKFKSLIDTYGAEKVFNAIAYSRFTRSLGVFVSIRNHVEKEFIEAPEKFKAAYSQEEFGKSKQKFYEAILKSYNSRVYKNGQYIIELLPNAYPHYPIDWIKKENQTANYEYEIKPDVFNNPFGLPIRKRAVRFASRWGKETVYAVLYQEEETITCLFLIKYPLGEYCTFGKKRHCSLHWQKKSKTSLGASEKICPRA